MKSTLLTLGLLLASLTAVHAGPVTLTVTSTSLGTLYGYSAGDSVTFTFTTESSFANNGNSTFDSTSNFWLEESTADSQMWSAISATGLTGAYVRPTVTPDDPNSRLVTLDTGGSDRLRYEANSDVSNIGLLTPTAQPVGSIQVDLFGVTDFPFSGFYTDPVAYFANFTGTYGPSGGTISLTPVGQSSLSFSPTSFTISAVPEPSAFAVLSGLAAFGGVFLARRRISALSGHENQPRP